MLDQLEHAGQHQPHRRRGEHRTRRAWLVDTGSPQRHHDDEDGQHRRADQLSGRSQEAAGGPAHPGDGQRTQHQQTRRHPERHPAAPRFAARPEALDQGDRRGDAPDHVQGQHEHRPRQPDAEPADVTVGEQVEAEVVRVEQRLGEQPLLDQAEGQTQQQDRRPTATGAAGDLADQHGPGPVPEAEHHEHAELGAHALVGGQVLVAEQELGDERRQQRQREHSSQIASHDHQGAPGAAPSLGKTSRPHRDSCHRWCAG